MFSRIVLCPSSRENTAANTVACCCQPVFRGCHRVDWVSQRHPQKHLEIFDVQLTDLLIYWHSYIFCAWRKQLFRRLNVTSKMNVICMFVFMKVGKTASIVTSVDHHSRAGLRVTHPRYTSIMGGQHAVLLESACIFLRSLPRLVFTWLRFAASCSGMLSLPATDLNNVHLCLHHPHTRLKSSFPRGNRLVGSPLVFFFEEIAMKTFGTELWKLYGKGSFFQEKCKNVSTKFQHLATSGRHNYAMVTDFQKFTTEGSAGFLIIHACR